MDHNDHERYYQLKVRKMRNVFKPRWWQLRRRYHIWKARRYAAKIRNELSPEGRIALDEVEHEFERRLLFGDKDDR